MDATVTETQKAILQLLHQQPQLTTRQIWQQVCPDRPKRHIERELMRLEQRCLIKARCDTPAGADADSASRTRVLTAADRETALLHPRGHTRVWMLLGRGARAIDAPFGNQYYRPKVDGQLAYQRMLVAIERQVLDAGWKLIAPVHYSARRPKPAITPQALHLMDAVEACERYEINQALQDPASNRQQLQARLARLQSGKLRELVPRTCNDYVVYRPGQAANVAILIPQPPNAGPLFWTRSSPKNSRAKLPPRPGRLPLYRPILALVPMAAIFLTPPPQSLQQILEDHQTAVLTAPRVAHFLADIVL